MEDEIDIYGDLDHLDDDQLGISAEGAKELRQENADLQRKVEELSNELERVNKYSKSLLNNISSLHKTAKVEIARKDRMITDLRQQLDNAAFRRNNNFRIPRKTPRPVVISLPPKDESTCTEIKKEQVNDTINKEETKYISPLVANQDDDDDDDTEHLYRPDKIPVTVFGERLRLKLEQESREEAEKAADKAQQPPDLDKPPQHLPNIDPVKSQEDKDNQYRLIPLTLQKLAENSRKRGSDNLERSDELKNSEKQDDHKTRASHDNKRRRMDDNKSRRDKSPNYTRKSENRKRMEIEAEYCCPGDNVKDEIYAKRRHENKLASSSRHHKTQSNGSRSRSKSRERRDRKEGRKDSYSSSNRTKENRALSKSPSRRHESEKIDKYRSSQRGNDRYGEKRRENSRDSKDSKRPIRKYASPPVGEIDLRRRLDRRNDDTAARRVPNGISTKNEMRRKTRNDSDTSRSHRQENSRESLRNSHVNKSEIHDRKRGNESKTIVDDRRKMHMDKNEKSESPSTETIKSNSVDEEIKIEECDKISTTLHNQQDSSDDIEEGEIPDSPSDTCENQTPSSTTDKIVAQVPETQNLDDSVKEEKIENIEMFIEKMQERDKEGETNNSSGVTHHNVVENNKNVLKNNINQTDCKTKTDMILKILEKDTSAESVHLTSILGDSSDEEVHQSHKKTIDINKVEKIYEKTAAAHNDSSPLNNFMHENVINELETANTVATLSTDKVPEKLVDAEENPSKGDSSQSKILEKPKNTTKFSVISEIENEKDDYEDMSRTSPKLFEALQGPRPILHEISSPSKASVKLNEIHEKKSVPKQKENSVKTSGAPAGKAIVVRRKKVRLSDTSHSWTVIVSDPNSVKKQ